MKNFRFALYLSVIAGFGGASAGSYEDFFAAIQQDNGNAISALLKRGFDPNTVDPKARPGLTIAAQAQAKNATNVLLAHPSLEVDAPNPQNETALMLAALKGDLDACQRMLARGAAVNRPGWAPLHYAATGPESKVTELLLGRGGEPNALSPNKTTPLMMAARYGNPAHIQLLLARGANPSLGNDQGLKAADFARLGGREELARTLAALQR